MAVDERRTRERWGTSLNRVGLFGCAAIAAMAVVAACAEGNDIVVVPADQGSGDGGGFLPTRSDASTCQKQCSPDLHNRVCGEDVVEACPPDMGCGKVGCVSPCEAASQNQAATGCEYFALRLPTQRNASVGQANEGDCFAVAVVNTWTTPVSLTVDRGGRSYDPSIFARIPSGKGRDLTYTPLPGGKLPAGEVALLFLAHNPGGSSRSLCPVTPAIANAEVGTTTDRGEAFRIAASAPVVAYDFLPWGAGYAAQLSASLLLPSSVWGFEHIAVDGYKHGKIWANQGTRPGDGVTAIAARENDTEVSFRSTGTVTIGNGYVSAGQTATFRLNRGEFFQILADVDELAGSAIRSNKPVGVWGGSTGLVVDEYKWCGQEAAHQQLPPIRAMGHEYVAVRFRNRYDGVEESPPWRIVGASPGARLSYIPERPAGAPESIGTGEVIDFRSPGGFIVKSQDEAHPFYMSAYMEGSPAFACSTWAKRRGGPEFVNVIATGQYLNSYRFFTDPAASETNLVVIRKRKGDAFHDVVLDCAGPLGNWTPIAKPGLVAEYEYTRTDLSRGVFEAQGQCHNGAHEMHSAAPFAVTVWGWATEAVAGEQRPVALAFPYNFGISYAFAAGMGVRPLNVIELPLVVK